MTEFTVRRMRAEFEAPLLAEIERLRADNFEMSADLERLREHVKTLRDVLEALAPDLHGYQSDIAGEALIETSDASHTRVGYDSSDR